MTKKKKNRFKEVSLPTVQIPTRPLPKVEKAIPKVDRKVGRRLGILSVRIVLLGILLFSVFIGISRGNFLSYLGSLLFVILVGIVFYFIGDVIDDKEDS